LGTTRSPLGWRNNERCEQWTVCPDMIRGGSNGLRAHFTRATISTCRLPQREQISRSRQSRTAVSAPYRVAISAGSGSTLMLAILAPNDQPELGSGGATQRHRRAYFGFHQRSRGGGSLLGRVARKARSEMSPRPRVAKVVQSPTSGYSTRYFFNRRSERGRTGK
jgi:hypothetical protein